MCHRKKNITYITTTTNPTVIQSGATVLNSNGQILSGGNGVITNANGVVSSSSNSSTANCEQGLKDCAALMQQGYQAAVATLGNEFNHTNNMGACNRGGFGRHWGRFRQNPYVQGRYGNYGVFGMQHPVSVCPPP